MSPTLSETTATKVRRLLSRREKKAKTSVSLSGELLRAADAVAGKAQRSALVERAVRAYLKSMVRKSRHQHDLDAINAHADRTNRASDELLDLQAWPE
jgi:metal-responsive CopG/Arc/MetJ family transcriptional regulator